MNIDGLNQRSGHLFVAGEDTDAILAEAGYSAAAIAELHTTGVLGG
jgi:crotonobetainyl-CoA:carnitine CoA-transferase CaiB-like acyl-CoA transferase